MPFFHMYWRRTLRRPGAALLWIALPFLFMTIYQAAFGGDDVPRSQLAVFDADSSIVSNFFVGALKQGPLQELLDVHAVAGLEEMDDRFASGDAAAGLVIPDGFGRALATQDSVSLTLYRNPRMFIQPQIVEGVLDVLAVVVNGAMSVFSEPLAMIGGFIEGEEDPDPQQVATVSRLIAEAGRDAPALGALASIDVRVRTEEEETTEGDDIENFGLATLFFPGLIMFGLLTLSLNLETRLLRDRINRVTQRMVIAPVPPAAIVLQQRLYIASFLYVVAVVSALLGGLIWELPAVGIAQANLISIALIIFIVGINGSIFGMSNSIKAVAAISSMVMMVLLILGGGFFPAEFTTEGFQAVSRLTPTGMANRGLTQSLTGRGLDISLPVLFAYCSVFFVASIVIGRRRLT